MRFSKIQKDGGFFFLTLSSLLSARFVHAQVSRAGARFSGDLIFQRGTWKCFGRVCDQKNTYFLDSFLNVLFLAISCHSG